MSMIGYSCGIMMVSAIIMIVHPKYEDGFIGRLALGGLVIGALVVILSELVSGQQYTQVPVEFNLMAVSLALFMLRHLYRFLSWAHSGKYAWDGRDRRARHGDRAAA